MACYFLHLALTRKTKCLPYVSPSLILKNPTLFFLGLGEQTAVVLCSNFGDTNKCTNALLLLLSSYMFRHCRLLHGAYTKISLKHTAIHTVQQTYVCFDVTDCVIVHLLTKPVLISHNARNEQRKHT